MINVKPIKFTIFKKLTALKKKYIPVSLFFDELNENEVALHFYHE